MGCTSSKEIEASNNSSKGKVEEAVVLKKNPLPVISAQPVVANNVSNNSSLRKIVARPKVLSVGCKDNNSIPFLNSKHNIEFLIFGDLL